MKKLLAAIALVLAFCLPVFALPACEVLFGGTAGGGTGDDIVGEQIEGEEQWRQAFVDALRAKTTNGGYVIKEEVTSNRGVVSFEATKSFDFINKKLYSKVKGRLEATSPESLNSLDIVESYMEIIDNFTYEYTKLTSELNGEIVPDSSYDWKTTKSNSDHFEDVTIYDLTNDNAFSESYYYDVLTASYLTSLTENEKSLSQLYSAFTFDEETKEYSAKLYCIMICYESMSTFTAPVNMKITFSKGKLAKYKIDADLTGMPCISDGAGVLIYQREIREVICKYDVDITIPEEAKNGTSM